MEFLKEKTRRIRVKIGTPLKDRWGSLTESMTDFNEEVRFQLQLEREDLEELSLDKLVKEEIIGQGNIHRKALGVNEFNRRSRLRRKPEI